MFEEQNERNMSNSSLIKKLFKYLLPNIHFFIIALIIMAISVGLNLLVPIIFKQATELLSQEEVVFSQMLKLSFIAFGLIIGVYVIEYAQTMILQHAGQKIVYNIRNDIFNKIEHLSIQQINQTPVGKLTTRVTSNTNDINDLFTNVIVNLIKSVVTLIGVIIFMFIIDVKLSLYMLIIMPVILIATFIFDIYARKAYRKVRNQATVVNAYLSENISGMNTTQIFNAGDKVVRGFIERNTDLRRASLKQMLLYAVYRPTIYVCYIITMIIVFYLGGKEAIALALNGDMSGIGTIVAFYLYIDRFFNPLQELAEQLNTLQSAFASCEKIFGILDMESNIQDKEDPIELDEVQGEIEFKHVWFAYEEENWILKDISFHIKPKEVVAFVGATGSGKTTILQLIVRNYDIQAGEILLDGINIKDISLKSLRSKFGQMLQDVFLFSGDILDNITMHDDTITAGDVKQACNYVGADQFIENLPNKYNEEVRERGNNFSSGQRQLISFARTIVHRPSIIILDEATANIDTETEVLIQHSLEKMMTIGTTLMVAHRLSTIQHANKIIVLSKGVILEEGTHQELLKNKGHYYTLYKLQYEKNIHKDVI